MLKVICLLLCFCITAHAEKTSFDLLKTQIGEHWKGRDIEIKCDHMTLENSLKKLPAGNIKEIQLSEDKRQFRASLFLSPQKKVVVTGQVHFLTKIPVLSRSIGPGEEIQEKDVTWKKLPTDQIAPQMILSHQDLLGHTPRHETLEPHEPILKNDLAPASKFIKKMDWVDVAYRVRMENPWRPD